MQEPLSNALKMGEITLTVIVVFNAFCSDLEIIAMNMK